MHYQHQLIEKKWQRYWYINKSFAATEATNAKKYYVLPMFPYPSGQLHIGHSRNYTFADIVARFKAVNGYSVLHPMGWDAFGLPAENAAIQSKIHPMEWTSSNISTMKAQLQHLGYAYDWEREINTCHPSYFQHEQEIFITLMEHGLAYQKESMVNWDPIDQTVLANEQVVDGRGWRSGAVVERKSLRQWFLRITDFAEELLLELNNLHGWPEKVLAMQEKWIGRSEGVVVQFEIDTTTITNNATTKLWNSNENLTTDTIQMPNSIPVYTTRPDTIFGAVFVAIACDHHIVTALEQTNELKLFLTHCSQLQSATKNLEKAEKMGYYTGIYVLHPFDRTIKIPVYITNFVLSDYGTGAIFGCPAHDERDHAFAVKYNLAIKQVVQEINTQELNSKQMMIATLKAHDVYEKAFTGEGITINSSFLNGLYTAEAKKVAIAKIEEMNIGYKKINYKLHNWGVSRQRYWGTPIPVIHCKTCGSVPVSRCDLPVVLPHDVDFTKGGNPLANHPTWKYVKCPKCHADAERETDTLDTFVESSWYFARFCATHAHNPIDKNAVQFWLPVDQYIGGIEHAVMHLLYARFFTKALRKCGYWDISEPFKNLLTQGMVCHTSYKKQDGQWLYPHQVQQEGDKYYCIDTSEEVECCGMEKMSKSKKNVITLDEIVTKYGADAARMFIVSDSPPERDIEWTEDGIESVYKYLGRVYDFVVDLVNCKHERYKSNINSCDHDHSDNDDSVELRKSIHKAIHDTTQCYEQMQFNKAVACIRTLSNTIFKHGNNGNLAEDAVSILLQLMNPITPHITEELWEILHSDGTTILQTKWPVADIALITDYYTTIAVQVNGKLRDTIAVPSNADEEDVHQYALQSHKVRSHVTQILKVIYVKGKIINFVCK